MHKNVLANHRFFILLLPIRRETVSLYKTLMSLRKIWFHMSYAWS